MRPAGRLPAQYRAIIRGADRDPTAAVGHGLLEEIRAAGYTGDNTAGGVRSCHHADAGAAPLIRFETPPGRRAHVGFAQFRFDWDIRYALLVVLG
jgi:hypothetical protein